MERQSIAWPVSQNPREAPRKHNRHQKMVVKQFERRNWGTTGGSSRPGNKHQKLPESNMWPTSGEQMQMCSQHEETMDHIVSGCEVLAKTEYISRHNNAVAYLHWSIFKIMMSRLQTTGTNTHQRLWCTRKTTTSPICRTCQSILVEL